MFPQIVSAFTDVAEMKRKRKARAIFSIKCSHDVLSIEEKIENWKKNKKKTTSVDEKETVEVKLRAVLVAYYILGNLRT